MQRHLIRFGVALWALALCATAFAHGVKKPSPYRWVSPPSGSDPKQALGGATSGSGTVLIDSPEGVQSVTTQDGQAAVSFTKGSISPKEGESEVWVTVTALDPMTFGPPPEGLIYDSNAYKVDLAYARSGERVDLTTDSCRPDQSGLCPTLAMRYAVGAHEMYVREADSWSRSESEVVDATFQVFAQLEKPGIFVAMGDIHPEKTGAPKAKRNQPDPSRQIAIGAGLIGAITAIAFGLRAARRKRRHG